MCLFWHEIAVFAVQGVASGPTLAVSAAVRRERNVMNRKWLRAFTTGAAMITAGVASAALAPTMKALHQLEPGQWELRERGQGGEVRRLCAADLEQLLQFRHSRASCKRFIVSDNPRELIVTYDCGVSGSGRTALRVETSRLAQIQAQGIADGAPFDMAVEARRVGICR